MDNRITRARRLVGAPFRLHGRDARGIDCVGVVAWAYDCAVPTGYALSTDDLAAIERPLIAAGLSRVSSDAPGDVFVLRVGPAQWHLGLWTGASLIHADAGLRRVVETPGWPRWPVIAMWRG